MEKAAAFLESRRYLAYLGGSVVSEEGGTFHAHPITGSCSCVSR